MMQSFIGISTFCILHRMPCDPLHNEPLDSVAFTVHPSYFESKVLNRFNVKFISNLQFKLLRRQT